MKTTLKILAVLAATGRAAMAAIVSAPNHPGTSAGGNSYNLSFSRDGQHLMFVSHANNLVTNDDLGVWLDLFVYNFATSNTVLVSASTNGFGGANSDANFPAISANGQIVAFASHASNLAPGISNYNSSQIFVRDLLAGTTRVASLSTNGNPASGGAAYPALSQDGRWLAFESSSDDLVSRPLGAGANDLGSLDVFARDLLANSNILVSVTTDGFGADSAKSYSPFITPDGRYVAFLSTVLNLPIGSVTPVSSMGDVYVRNLQFGTTTWVSTNLPAIFSNAGYRCSNPVLSDDGRYAAFVPSRLDVSGSYVLRHDLQTGTTLVLSSAETNVLHEIQMTSDGGRVLFEESSDGTRKVRLWDAASGTNRNIACDLGGDARNAFMTTDGSRVVFVACSNIYALTVASDSSVLVSADVNGAPVSGSFDLTFPTISVDGSRVSFDHRGHYLVPDDLNGASDVFLRDLNSGAIKLVTKAMPSTPSKESFAHSFLGPNSVSADGRFIVSTRYDDPSFFRDTNGWRDVYVSDTVTGRSHALSIDTNLYSSAVGGPPFSLENTNMYSNPIISADGSTIAALRGLLSNPIFVERVDVVWASSSNGVFGSGVSIANRSDINGGIGNGNSFAPSLSADGRTIVFTTTSSDLVANDTYHSPDVVLRRRFMLSNGLWSASNYLVSVSLSGTSSYGVSSNGFISPDGRWVVFQNNADDLVAPSPGIGWKLYARDLELNETHLIPLSLQPLTALSISGNSRYVPLLLTSAVLVYDLHSRTVRTNASVIYPPLISSPPNVSDDGRLVSYVSRSNAQYRVLVSNLETGETELVSDSRGLMGLALLSRDGRYVVYARNASASGVSETNSPSDIFVRDRLLGVTMAVSVNPQGRTGNSSSTRPVLAADGRTVVFQSFATDLAAGSYSDKQNLFLLKLGSADTDGDGIDDDWEVTYFGNLSRTGSADFDSDGATDYSEFVAGTDPTNNNSVFRVLTVAPVGGGNKLLFWTGNPARNYRAEFKDGLASSNWSPLDGTISWNGSTASITDGTASGASNRFYRVVRLP